MTSNHPGLFLLHYIDFGMYSCCPSDHPAQGSTRCSPLGQPAVCGVAGNGGSDNMNRFDQSLLRSVRPTSDAVPRAWPCSMYSVGMHNLRQYRDIVSPRVQIRIWLVSGAVADCRAPHILFDLAERPPYRTRLDRWLRARPSHSIIQTHCGSASE